jgi:signal recognition particle receptor subunit beta
MVFFNYSTMQMAAKVVYYGPGLCGKTTNLHYIYGHTTTDSRGEMVSLETETDRTLFFDLLPLDVGSIAGFNTRIQLYTVPGQVFYNTTRKLVLKGVDGVVFVVDSQRATLQANLDSFRNLEENLSEMGLSVDTLPMVLQYNKRDLAEIFSVEELNQALNRQGWPWFEASAVSGQGVFETLKGISKYTLLALKKRLGRSGAEAPTRLSAPSAGPVPRPASFPPPFPMAVRPAATGPEAPAPAATTPPAAGVEAVAVSPGGGATAVAAEAPAPAATAGAAPSAAPSPGKAAAVPAAAGASAGGPAATEPAAAPADAPKARSAAKISTGKSRSLDVLSELEKLRREAMQPAPSPPASSAAAAGPPLPSSPEGRLAAMPGAGPARHAAANGRGELSRNIEMTLKRSEFARARRFLVSFQVEDDQHRVVDAVRDLPVEIKDTTDLDKLLLRFNVALHAKE